MVTRYLVVLSFLRELNAGLPGVLDIFPIFFSRKLWSTVLFATAISSNSHNELHEWVNDKGETIYSEKKPQKPKVSVSEIKNRVS